MQRYIFKLTNELLTVSRMLGLNEIYNPNIDIIDRIFYDYFAKISRYFRMLWERYVTAKPTLRIKRREYEQFFSQQTLIPNNTSPKEVKAAYDLLYTELIKYIQETFAITATKTNVGLIYEHDTDLSQELNHFIIYNAQKIFKKLKKTEQNVRLKHKSACQKLETLHHLGTSKDWIDFECEFRKIETQVCSILEEWNTQTKQEPEFMATFSKRTKLNIIKLFQDTFPESHTDTRKLWKKIITLNRRRPLSISYQPLRTLINILERYPEKRIREKQEVLKARTSFFTDDLTFTQ